MKNVYQMEANVFFFKCPHISLFKPSVFLIMEMIFQTLWISNAGRDSSSWQVA